MAEKSKTRRIGVQTVLLFLPLILTGCMVSKSTYQAETVRAGDLEAQNKDLLTRLRDQSQNQRELEARLTESETARADLLKKLKVAGAGAVDANEGLESCWKERDSLISKLDVETRSLQSSEEKVAELKATIKGLEEKAKSSGTEADARNAKLAASLEQLRTRLMELEAERDIFAEQKNRISREKNERLDEMARNSESLIEGLKKDCDEKIETTSRTYEDLLKIAETECQGRVDELTKTYEALVDSLKKPEKERLARIGAAFEKLSGELKTPIQKGTISLADAKDHLTIEIQNEDLFVPGKTDLVGAGKDLLMKLGKVVNTLDGAQVIVEAHTDNVPIGGTMAEKYPTNWELSVARAVSVVRFLDEKATLASSRLAAQGRGDTMPVSDNGTREGRAKNRRVEIKIHFEE